MGMTYSHYTMFMWMWNLEGRPTEARAAICWTSIGGTAKGLPTTVVTRIAVDPANADIAYATFSGFLNGPHVFKTTNKGGTWTSVSAGLPAIPMNTITIETSSILWVGGDDG